MYGIAEAVDEMRQIVGAAERAAQWRAANEAKGGP